MCLYVMIIYLFWAIYYSSDIYYYYHHLFYVLLLWSLRQKVKQVQQMQCALFSSQFDWLCKWTSSIYLWFEQNQVNIYSVSILISFFSLSVWWENVAAFVVYTCFSFEIMLLDILKCCWNFAKWKNWCMLANDKKMDTNTINSSFLFFFLLPSISLWKMHENFLLLFFISIKNVN